MIIAAQWCAYIPQNTVLFSGQYVALTPNSLDHLVPRILQQEVGTSLVDESRRLSGEKFAAPLPSALHSSLPRTSSVMTLVLPKPQPPNNGVEMTTCSATICS